MAKIATKNGYYFNEESNKLESFEIKRVIFTLKEDSLVKYECKLGGVDTTLESVALPIYATKEHFETDIKIELQTPRRCASISRIIPKDGKVWGFKNGQAYSVLSHDIELCATMGEDGVLTYSSLNGEEYYNSREDVFQNNDYIIKNADGTEQLVKCTASKMTFSEHQLAIIKELEEVLAKCKESKINFIVDTYNEDLVAYNSANNNGVRVSYYDDNDPHYTNVDKFGTPIKASMMFSGEYDIVVAHFD